MLNNEKLKLKKKNMIVTRLPLLHTRTSTCTGVKCLCVCVLTESAALLWHNALQLVRIGCIWTETQVINKGTRRREKGSRGLAN